VQVYGVDHSAVPTVLEVHLYRVADTDSDERFASAEPLLVGRSAERPEHLGRKAREDGARSQDRDGVQARHHAALARGGPGGRAAFRDHDRPARGGR
jgi:hypothetical protein